MKNDQVNHPKHYNSHPSGIECKDIASYFPAPLSNAIKYIWRYEDKENPIQDLEKCLWYCNSALCDFPDGMIAEQLQITATYLDQSKIDKYIAHESNAERKEFMQVISVILSSQEIRHVKHLRTILSSMIGKLKK